MTSLAHRKKICQGTEYYQKMPLRRNYLKLDGKNSAVHVTLQLKNGFLSTAGLVFCCHLMLLQACWARENAVITTQLQGVRTLAPL